MSSQWAPMQSTTPPCANAPSSSACMRASGLPDLPGRLAARQQVLEALLVLEGVHARPEAVVGVSAQLALRDQAAERLDHQLLAGLDVVEDLAPEHEEAAVDADHRLADVLEPLHRAARVGFDDVEGV